MTTYNWTINNLYTKTVDGLQDYVVTAMYNVTGVDGEFSSSCLLYTSPSPRDREKSRMPSSA